MTQTLEPPAVAPARPLASRWGVGLGLLLLVTGVVLGLAWERSQDVEWLHERARMGVKVVSIEHDGWQFVAEEVEGRRIRRLKVILTAFEKDDEEQPASNGGGEAK